MPALLKAFLLSALSFSKRGPQEEDEDSTRVVSIRVDTGHLTSPALTTGGHLYALAHVRWGYDLWRVQPGK